LLTTTLVENRLRSTILDMVVNKAGINSHLILNGVLGCGLLTDFSAILAARNELWYVGKTLKKTKKIAVLTACALGDWP